MEDTTIQENDTLIAEMIRDAEAAVRDDSAEVVHKGDDEQPAPMIVSRVGGDDGLRYIYDTNTGERSVALKYMLPVLLNATREDGTLRFTTKEPVFSPPRGTLKCMLHQDSPNRKYYDTLGLPVCRKSNLTAPYMVEKHMKNRHATAWAIIERERVEKEKQEEKEERRALYQSITGNNPSNKLDAMTSDLARDVIVDNIMEEAEKKVPVKPKGRPRKK